MALDFDGVNDYVDHGDIAAIDTASALTSMLWVNVDTSVVSDSIFGKGGELLLYVDGSGDGTSIAAGQSGVWERKTGNGVLSAGNWVHIASVYDGSLAAANRIVIYKNGVSESLSGTTPGVTLSDQGATTVKVAGNLTGLGFMDAKVGVLKIWSAALTAAEILSEMLTVRPQRTANLILWAPYDDGTSSRDYSGNANHGTVTEATLTTGPPVTYGAPVLIG